MCAAVLAGVSARVVVNESVYVRVCACGCVRAREMIPVSRSFIQTKKRKWNFKGFLVFCHVLGFFWVDWSPSVDILDDGFESRLQRLIREHSSRLPLLVRERFKK